MSIERSALSALKWMALAKLVGQVLNWGITLLVIRILAPAEYGLMAMSVAIISVTSIVAELGLGASLVQVERLDRKELSNVTGAVMLLTLGAALLVSLLAPVAASFMNEPRLTAVIWVATLQLVFSSISAIPQSLVTREMNFRRLAWIEISTGLLASVATLGLAWLGAGVWALVTGYVVGAAVRAALLLSQPGAWIRPTFGLAGVQRHLRFGGTLTIGRLAWQVLSQLDVVVAGRFLGQEAVGIYSVALVLASMPMQKMMAIVNQVAFPTVARMQRDPDRLQRRLVEAMRMVAFLGVPIAWGLASVAPEFVAVVFGERWTRAVVPLQIMCVMVPFRMVGSLLITSAAAVGSAKTELSNTLISAVVLPAAFLLGVRWGIVGLAFGWLAGIMICYAVIIPRACSVVGIRLRRIAGVMWPGLLAGAVMCLGVIPLRNVTYPTGDAHRLVLLVCGEALFYVLLISILDRKIWQDIRNLLSKF